MPRDRGQDLRSAAEFPQSQPPECRVGQPKPLECVVARGDRAGDDDFLALLDDELESVEKAGTFRFFMLSEQVGCFGKRIWSDKYLLWVEQVNQVIEIFPCESSQSAMLGDQVSPNTAYDE